MGSGDLSASEEFNQPLLLLLPPPPPLLLLLLGAAAVKSVVCTDNVTLVVPSEGKYL